MRVSRVLIRLTESCILLGMDEARVAFQILVAGNTLAGLTLVFLGHTASSFDSYGADQQSPRVKRRHQVRAWLAFGGLVLSLVAASCGLLHSLTACKFLLPVGVVAIFLAMGSVGIAAFRTAWGIK